MKKLKNILLGFDFKLVQGDIEQDLAGIEFDSREVRKNYAFVAVNGLNSDGHAYIDAAVEQGASVIICQKLPKNLKKNTTYISTQNSARALGILASNFYDKPSEKLKVVGITGTNGKTTNATLLFSLFRKLGYSVGLLSTIQNQINEEVLDTKFTTPYPVQTQKLLAQMLKKGCTHCFMEVSSHAIDQERIAGIKFRGAVFTNITHDHLDYHKTFLNYINAKKKFFDDLSESAFALVNLDDKRGLVMLQNCQAKTQKTFALRNFADFKAKIIESTKHGLLLELQGKQVWFRLIGDFNAYNLLSVYAVALLLGEEEEAILTELSGLQSVSGRFEQIISKKGTTAIVDYAHTPDALKNILETLNQVRESEESIISVVGCGGDRDKSKRPLMAQIAVEWSDKVFLTSDNPRTENPYQILEDMLAGLDEKEKSQVRVIENREEAIKAACETAIAKDIILVAGKGHESYQEINGIRYNFDDKEKLMKFLK